MLMSPFEKIELIVPVQFVWSWKHDYLCNFSDLRWILEWVGDMLSIGDQFILHNHGSIFIEYCA